MQRRVAAPIAGAPPAKTVANGAPRVQYFEDFYVYTANFLALAPDASQIFSIQIQADADFKWIKSTYQADIAEAAFTAATQPVPNVTVQLTDTGTGKQLFQTPVPIATLFGIGQLPFILPIARMFSARSSIQVTVANYDAAVTYGIQLQFIGMKVWQQ
jgi:hypothetical protein